MQQYRITSTDAERYIKVINFLRMSEGRLIPSKENSEKGSIKDVIKDEGSITSTIEIFTSGNVKYFDAITTHYGLDDQIAKIDDQK